MRKISSIIISLVFILNTAFGYTQTVTVKGVDLVVTTEPGNTVEIQPKLPEISGWKVNSGDITITNNQFVMPEENVEIEAIIEEEPETYLLTVDTPLFTQTEEKTEGEVITVTAISSDNYLFTNWNATGITLTEEQQKSETITFTMPGNAVQLEGVYLYGEYTLLNYYNAEHNNGANVYDSSATTFVDLMGNNNGTLGGTRWEGSNTIEDSSLMPQWEDGALVFNSTLTGNSFANGELGSIGGYVALDTRNIEHPAVETVFELETIGYKQQIVCNTENAGYALVLADNGQLYFAVSLNGEYVYARCNEILETGKKYHALACYDGNAVKLYIDGEKVAETSASGNIDIPDAFSGLDTELVLGGNARGNIGTHEFFDGKIYLLKIYDGALTDEQVYQQYLFTQEY